MNASRKRDIDSIHDALDRELRRRFGEEPRRWIGKVVLDGMARVGLEIGRFDVIATYPVGVVKTDEDMFRVFEGLMKFALEHVPHGDANN